MLWTVGGRPGLRRLLVSYLPAVSLRCQASSVAEVTGKTSLQRDRIVPVGGRQRCRGRSSADLGRVDATQSYLPGYEELVGGMCKRKQSGSLAKPNVQGIT